MKAKTLKNTSVSSFEFRLYVNSLSDKQQKRQTEAYLVSAREMSQENV